MSKDLTSIIKEAGQKADRAMMRIRRDSTVNRDLAASVVSEELRKIESLFGEDAEILTKHPDALKEAVRYRPLVMDERGLTVGDLRIIEFLIKNGADIHRVFDNGATLFIIACGGAKTDIVKLLYDHGADVNAVTHDNNTAYGIVDCHRAFNNREEMWGFLNGIEGLRKDLHTQYKACADAWINFCSQDPKTITAEMIDEFVKGQAEERNLTADIVLNLRVNDQGKMEFGNYNTPLHLVAGLGRIDLFYHMLTSGAKMGVDNRAGKAAEEIMGPEKVKSLMDSLKIDIDKGTSEAFPEALIDMVASYLIAKPGVKEVKKGSEDKKLPSLKPVSTSAVSLVSAAKDFLGSDINSQRK